MSGCPIFDASGIPGEEEDDPEGESAGEVTRRTQDVSGKIAIAVGGVAPGSDEIVIDEAFRLLDFETDDDDLFDLEPIEGAASFAAGGGARVVAKRPGIGYVTPVLDGRPRSAIEVIIPPQKLIQILVGEARGQLDGEATVDDDEAVRASSVSVTGDAIGSVIRNRIELINDLGSPSLFAADPTAYDFSPPVSTYEAVIEAEREGFFQFEPVDPEALSHSSYLDAADRDNVARSTLIAYDQAVLTAAYVFSGDTDDPTTDGTVEGAFGFYSPDNDEWDVLEEAMSSKTLDLPEGAGKSDASFPALAPIQILILNDIAPSERNDEVPSFVFVRTRHPDDPAVTDEP